MNLIRRLILSLALIAGIAPASAQTPIPALPDTERRTSYSINASTCACAVNFQLYGDGADYQNWLEVSVNGVVLPQPGNWTIASPSGPLANLARPISDAVLTFTNVQTGTVQIVGARRPRRTSQFSENAGVSAHNLNQVFSDIAATQREVWDKTNDFTGRGVFAPPGETLSILPPLANRAGMGACFDSLGSLAACVGAPSGGFTAGTGITFTGTNPTVISTGTLSFSPQFGGRLTLRAGQSVMTADAVSSQTVYYAPDQGPYVPVWNGSAWVLQNFLSGPTDQVGLSLNLAGSASWPAGTIHDVFAYWNGSAVALATRQWDAGMLPVTAQITNATLITTGTGPNTWTRASNAFDGTTVRTTATSAVLVTSNNNQDVNCLGQDWGAGNPQVLTQVAATAPTDDFLLHTGPASLQVTTYGSNDNANWQIIDVRYINAGAIGVGGTATLAINASYTTPYRYDRFCVRGDGVNNVLIAQLKFYATAAPAGGRRLVKSNGILVNDAGITGRLTASTTTAIAANQATFLGTIQIDAGGNGAVTAHVNPGPSRVYNVWNAENQVNITVRAAFNTLAATNVAGYTYNIASNQTWTSIQGATYSINVLIGYPRDPVSVDLIRGVFFNAAAGNASGYGAGIGVDTITGGFSGTECSVTVDSTGPQVGLQCRADLTFPPFSGSHLLTAIETLGTSVGTVSLFTDIRNTRMQASWRG